MNELYSRTNSEWRWHCYLASDHLLKWAKILVKKEPGNYRVVFNKE